MIRHRKVSSLHSAASRARTTSVIMKQVDATSAISALTVASCASSTALADTRTALERRVARGAREDTRGMETNCTDLAWEEAPQQGAKRR